MIGASPLIGTVKRDGGDTKNSLGTKKSVSADSFVIVFLVSLLCCASCELTAFFIAEKQYHSSLFRIHGGASSNLSIGMFIRLSNVAANDGSGGSNTPKRGSPVARWVCRFYV